MTFRLDYNRRSDLDDSVGYWYVQPKGRPSRDGEQVCRVFYSCDTKMRQWVPGPVYALLTKKALTQTTTWVYDEALKEWAKEKAARAEEGTDGPLGNLGRGLRDARGRLGDLKPKLPTPALPNPFKPRSRRKRVVSGAREPEDDYDDDVEVQPPSSAESEMMGTGEAHVCDSRVPRASPLVRMCASVDNARRRALRRPVLLQAARLQPKQQPLGALRRGRGHS